MMEQWIKDNFPKRSISYNYEQKNKNSRVPSPTTVYEVRDIFSGNINYIILYNIYLE